jgi:hypothetical protein
VGELLHQPTPAGFKNQNIGFVCGVYPAIYKAVSGRLPVHPSPSQGGGITVEVGLNKITAD